MYGASSQENIDFISESVAEEPKMSINPCSLQVVLSEIIASHILRKDLGLNTCHKIQL